MDQSAKAIIQRFIYLFQGISLAVLLILGSLVGLKNFTGNFETKPILAASISQPASIPPYQPSTSVNPVANVFINAVPGTDGRELFVSATGAGAAENEIRLNIDPGLGGGAHKGSYAMTLSSTAYIATAIGFSSGQDVGKDGDDTMSITTTVGSEVMGTGEINFQRAFVETTQPEMIIVDDGDFVLEILNTGTVPINTYLLVMSTNAPPGPVPLGYQLVSKSYNVRPSGSLTQSEKLMTLDLRFAEPLPGGNDPHTLTIIRWNLLTQIWEDVGGTLLNDSQMVTLAIKDFGIYALATAPRWRDSFNEASLSGVSALSNTQRGPGQSIILSSNATLGTVTSIPIIPTSGDAWGTLHFSGTVPASTSLTVDVLDMSHKVILADVRAGTNLDTAGVTLEAYPQVKLRATLTAEAVSLTPELHEWSLTWLVEERRIYLPFIVKSES